MPIENVRLGEGVKIWHPNLVNLYGCQIGEDTQVGPFVEIQKGVVVGQNCTISTSAFLCEGVTLGDGVFIGHGVKFINEKHPKAGRRGWTLPPENAIHVGDRATIGTGATIMPGVAIGRDAEVGAGALIIRDVPAGAVVITKVQTVILYEKTYKPGWQEW